MQIKVYYLIGKAEVALSKFIKSYFQSFLRYYGKLRRRSRMNDQQKL